MNRSGRMLGLLLVTAVVAGGCSAGKSSKPSNSPAKSTSKASAGISDDAAVSAAEKWLDGWSDLDKTTRSALKKGNVVHGPKVTHVHFAQVYEDHPVRGAEVVVHVLDNGTVEGASSSLAKVDAPPPTEAKVDEKKAKSIAAKAAPDPVRGESNAKVVWLQDGRRLRLGWSVTMSTETSKKRGAATIWVDAVTGAVADAQEYTLSERAAAAGTAATAPIDRTAAPSAATSRCDIKSVPAACLFAPDPVSADGGTAPSIDDADNFLTAQSLLGLKDPKSGALVGEFVNLEPPGVQPVRKPDGKWNEGRGEPGFEATMAYFWIDHTQREIQRLGFTNMRNEPMAVVPVDPKTEDNAFYDPDAQSLFLGVGSRGVNTAEDGGVIIHEYGHAILDQQVPGLLLNPEGKAYHEAFGDLLAFLTTLETRKGDQACMFPWLFDKCLRRLDANLHYPEDLDHEEHDDSQIVSGAVFDIVKGLLAKDNLDVNNCSSGQDCTKVRDRVLTTLLSSTQFLTPNSTLPDAAAAFERANQVVFDGQDADLIASAFSKRGLDKPGPGTVGTNGDAGTAGKVVVDLSVAHPSRGELQVVVGVVDKNFKSLCEPVTVVDADPKDTTENLIGQLDVSDSPCAKFAPPGPDQQWVLQVIDNKAGNVGRIDSFKVIADGVPFLATGVPKPVADNDTDGTGVLIDGSGAAVPDEGQQSIDQSASQDSQSSSAPTATVAITHPHMGDLSVRAGVADAGGKVLCSVPVQDPDPANDQANAKGDIDLSQCAKFYPPDAQHRWFLEVSDTSADDTGTVDEFTVTGPDGEHAASKVPVQIPDDDEDGVVVFAS